MGLAVRDSSRMIPAEVTEFVGRRRDLGEVRRMLSASRLVMLTGFGGIGKTRLAVQLARQLERAYPDGVCFVSLGDLSDASLIAEATASALQIHDHAGPISVPELAGFLRPRELLLVLDNCEHVIDDCASLVAILLRSCPRLHVLATSREALRVDGEFVWRVEPLMVPPSGAEGVGVAQEYDAVRLLADRATRLAPEFEVSEHNIAAIIEVCRVLDGVPLALELAAVRLRALSPDDLLEQLQDRWQALDVGTRGAPARQSAMSACLAWSHDLCSAEERQLWALLSVFAGGMEMPAIRYVAARADPDLAEAVVEHVQSLVDKSILTVENSERHARYRMIEVIRQFGSAQLTESGRLAETQLWHRDWCADLLATSEDDWMSSRQALVVDQLRREEQNLREALTTCWRQADEAETGLEMAARLRNFAIIRGTFTEMRGWLHRFLPMAPQGGMTRMHGLCAAVWLAALQGDHAEAAEGVREARQLAQALDPASTWLVTQAEGLHVTFLGDFERSVTLYVEALDGLEQSCERERAETLALLGQSYGLGGQLEQATVTLEECLALCSRTGESWCRSYGLWFAGLVAWQRGDDPEAVRLVREALEVNRLIDDRLLSALCFEALAWCQAGISPSAAATLLGAADALWDLMGSSIGASPGLSSLHKACEASLRQTLSDGFGDLRQVGAALGPLAAADYALGKTRPRSDAPTSKNEMASTPTLLTRREHEVAQLVTQGMSNREIASTLFISPRTAETHVENILLKLGFHSRAQIAAWFSTRLA
ncbi:LuxR C-terminal-related transcriptional regulator [Aeromicrobium ginsengisoli]|uniref:HTH luxR-type domain-containing protein n=1 Tax=Aeromicrobium ginsengisoli TaxID=363867 RepID=A0A5M4FEL0_9ACTN|nr:LuxR C-terminal-related transcriptional regulator [Aeromicrobium ginsengisoli]KAA1397787.1 hypothetical protein ESP70_010600 [Aeromicrobium ginsengisoli]